MLIVCGRYACEILVCAAALVVGAAVARCLGKGWRYGGAAGAPKGDDRRRRC